MSDRLHTYIIRWGHSDPISKGYSEGEHVEFAFTAEDAIAQYRINTFGGARILGIKPMADPPPPSAPEPKP